MQHHKFEALDGLRGLFALTIVLLHFNVQSHLYDFHPLRAGYMVVDFFFVLSGFVISHASLTALTGGKPLGLFILRRFGRIWPLHAAVLAAFVALEGIKWLLELKSGLHGAHTAFDPTGTNSLPAIFTNLLLIQSLGLHAVSTWNFPSWSISTEFYTYIVFAVLAVTCRRLFSFLAAAIVLACLIILACNVRNIDVATDYGFPRCLYGFFTGHLVYRLYRATPGKIACPGLTEALCLLLIFGFLEAAGFTKLSLLAPLVMALGVWVFACQQGPVSRFLQTPALQYLGTLSYSLYITHALVIITLNRAVTMLEQLIHHPLTTLHPATAWVQNPISVITFGSPWVMDALTPLYLATTILLAALATRLIETPARNFINTFAKRIS